MQVGDSKKNNMNDFSDNTCKTLTPITTLLKIFGLNSDVLRVYERKSYSYCKLLLMGSIFASLSMFVIYYKVKYLHDELTISVRLTDYIQTVYDYIQYVIDLFFVHKYGGRYYREYFLQYQAIDQIIGTGSCSTIRKRLTKLVTFFIVIWMITSTLDYLAWLMSNGWIVTSVFSVAYLYFFIKILNILDLTSQTMHVEVRLRIIGDLVQSYYTTIDTQPGVMCDSLKNKNWLYTSAELRTKEREALHAYAANKCHEIRWLSRCYLLLSEQCAFINKMFGIRLLMNSLSLLIDMVRFSNLAVKIITGSQVVQHTSQYFFFPVMSTISRLLTCVIILISLVSHCQKVYQQADRIINITDHLLLNKKSEPVMRNAVIELRELVQNRPISFHLANFLRLDYTMLLSTASVVVTYTIILLQSMN